MKFDKTQINLIEEFIKARRKENKLAKCCFYITIPQYKEKISDFVKTLPIRKVQEILIRNKVNYQVCDTIPAAFNLNKLFIETTSPLECAVEYFGFYPDNWEIEDILMLSNMEREGLICISVFYLNDDGSIKTWNN